MYIPKIEAKDLYISNFELHKDYTLKRSDGKTNYRKFKAGLDYSLDLIKMKEVYESVYRNKKFSERHKGEDYCPFVINVTFNFSAKEYNRAGANTYIKIGYDNSTMKFEDCVCVIDGELAGIITGKEVESPVDDKVLGKYFYLSDNKYCAKTNIRTTKNVSDIRKELYIHGFNIDGTHYVRYKRSAGSARVGRCLFIAEPLFAKMRKWENCGISVKPGDELDLAAYESYISLTSSSIIDTVTIEPSNILVIDDFESVFDDDVISVTESHGELESTHMRTTIENSIWDGESMMDKSLMPEEYQDKGMLLLRNRFFKSCCFNANIQQWFADNNITDVKQLNGFTLAESIDQVKLITTPSSIKYVKFGTLQQWFDMLDTRFGLVKYEKEQKYFDGRMTQSHYQLINSIQLSRTEVDKLLEPTFEFMRNARTNPAVLKHWIKFNIADFENITPAVSKTDVVYKLMSVNPDFCKTKMYRDFRQDFLKSFTKNLKCGHVLVNGNYSTLCGNPISMLKSAIGKFDGKSEFDVGTISTTRFDWNKRVLASRSPHITASNVLITTNKEYADVDKYMNATPEIIYINSINENILQKLAGCDFDSDTVMITDNEVLINAASRNDKRFKVAVCNVGGVKTKRKYTPEDLADLDIKTSKNLIGEIINLSQVLNSIIWDRLADGAKMQDIDEIYLDVCKLSILSGIAIDRAKREFVINDAREIRKIKNKYSIETDDGKQINPNFFKHISMLKGYYNPEKKAYLKHDTAMDYLISSVNSFRASRKDRNAANEQDFIELSDMLDNSLFDKSKANYRQVREIISTVDHMKNEISAIFSSSASTGGYQFIEADRIRQDCVEAIGKMKINNSTMIALLKLLEKPGHAHHKKMITYILFSYPSTSFYEVLAKSRKPIPYIEECEDGEIDIYGVRFTEKSDANLANIA